MSRNLTFLFSNLTESIIGNYEFLENHQIHIPLLNGYKINKERIEKLQKIIFGFSIAVFAFQLIISQGTYFIFGLIQLSLFFLALRGINYLIRLKFNKFQFKMETIGYFVMNELLIILETSKSLRNAVKYVSMGNYPFYSDIFSNALLEAHFGNVLPELLKANFSILLPKQISETLVLIIDTWDYGKNITLLNKNLIIAKLAEKIIEKTEKIEIWTSLSSGLIFLSPPIVLCFLLISGKMSSILGILIPGSITIISLFLQGDSEIGFFSTNNVDTLSYDAHEIEFLVLLAEYLSRGFSFAKSMNQSMKIYRNKLELSITKDFVQTQLDGKEKSKNDLLETLFKRRTIYLLNLVEKYALLDPVEAGEKTLKITQDLSKTNELLNKGRAKLRAIALQENVIQLLSIISLASIAGASPIFLFVEMAVNYSFRQPLNLNLISPFELEFFLVALTLSLLPLKNFNLSRLRKGEILQFGLSFKIIKFLLFVILYWGVRSIFLTSF
ncbi:MAG: hypothetical protein EAX86_08995 [Candidatus Heimdallarchaeota archaeon]|nr:hypothetical protein [Candidatus Heimdallarchaeota archaeon]